MENLRIVSVQVIDSSNIDVKFTHDLTSNLVPANISILADNPDIPSSQVLKITINQDTLSIVCQPLTPMATYFLQFQSTPSNPFISLHGDAKISEDGVSNRFLITGPIDSDNPVKNYLQAFLKDNIYNLEEGTFISKYINSLAITLSRALYDIRQIKNENYLSFIITDESKVRGSGPFDRLSEESAYEIIRVGRGNSQANANTIFMFDDFPTFPITLQKEIVSETLQVSSLDEPGKFNINDLILNLGHLPITKINSIVFTLATIDPIFIYDIDTLGYQIENSRYDQDFASTYLQLADNQVKLNEAILLDPKFAIDLILKVDVQYEYKNLGKIINDNTVSVYTTLTSIREFLPPIINVFNLQHAPIVDSNNAIPILGGISFIDPNTNIPGALHPAFLMEIPFRLNALPAAPGQYSVDYATGTVYVYGNDSLNNGTGPFPPLATYQYRFTYKSEIDYVYDTDSRDLVALPLGNLVNSVGNIAFNYEEVLIPNIDYVANLHQEALDERVENRLVALNTIKTKNTPITNVFRILNETSGEIYTINRWSNDKIYFRFNSPPNIGTQINERTTFKSILGELLFVNTTFTNSSSLRVFKIFLNNNLIIAGTEDGIGTSFNSSLTFDGNVFKNEKYFDKEEDETGNINRLKSIGEYVVDYVNGIIYCAVSNTQSFSIGSANYKVNNISPQFSHLISVDDIYYCISPLTPKNKQFQYLSFDEGFIIPENLDPSDELFLNGNNTSPYQIVGGNIGAFVDATFISGVTNQIKFVRSVFEHEDLLNSSHPLNFASVSSSSDFNIVVGSISKQITETVQFDGTNYFVLVNENVPYLSSRITYNFSVIRSSDSAQLWNNSGVVMPGNPIKLVLPGINSPMAGDLVTVNYTFTINEFSRVIVDYNKGDLFVDYTYVADEIIISYEYGDNSIDFRRNTNLPANSQYFVTYKVGALRDALLKNFGNLVNISELTNFDINFDRERYRDAVFAALSSFIQGPTVTALKNIGKTISHIEPEIIESAFTGWSLGNSLLSPESISTTGQFQLLPAKFGNGVLVNNPDQTITMPFNSNLRLEEGTFETWIIPQWNGLDNDADLTFNITLDGYAVSPLFVFIGASEYHPTINNGTFTLNKNSQVIGSPNKNKDGIFIYYDKDISSNFYRWYVEILDGYVDGYAYGYVDGYVDGYSDGYSDGYFDLHRAFKFKINSTGSFYDTKSLISPKPTEMTIFTGTNSLNLSITGGHGRIDEGITFVSDLDHYILDVGEEKNKNRFSIFKDSSGYLNFKVFDRDKTSYTVSSDVSAWKINDLHHIATSWKLNTRNNRDEMHLFIDGQEVPNIIKYGQNLRPYLHEKFRTVNPEEIVGLSNRDIVGSTDLITTVGSDLVSSLINFSAFNIFPGDLIFIDEVGFSTAGYTILNVSGQNLTLNSPMPISLSSGRFSVNRTKFIVTSDIDIAPNIAVSTIHQQLEGADLSGSMGANVVSSTGTNFTLQNVVPGDLIRIENISLPISYVILAVSGNSLTINDTLPINLINEIFHVYSNNENELPGIRAIHPDYSISKDSNFNNILTISNDVFADDLILIRTLGLNHRTIKNKYYVWSTGKENILMTRLPPPISLDEAKIIKVILPVLAIGPSNSTLSGGIFNSNNFNTDQPSISQNGRTLSVTLAGTNVDFSVPVTVTIVGNTVTSIVTETINFTDYSILDSVNMYISIDHVNISVKPINPSKNAVSLGIKEKYSITHPELSGLYPVIKFSYQIGGGFSLQSDGYGMVEDLNNLFSGLDINNYLVINSPPSVAGFYLIIGLSADRKTLTIEPTSTSTSLPLPSFTGGIYQILNVNSARSGLQNGFFTFEAVNMPGQPYFLNQGFYELEYSSYITAKFDPLNTDMFIGSNFSETMQVNGILDQIKIYSTMLTDIRIGETLPSNQHAITKDFNSIKPLKKDSTTLALISFDQFPFTNNADFYITPSSIPKHFQSAFAVNENFGNSTVILDKPIVINNDGILDTRKEGSIEFWTSPIFDTGNDPNVRYYFDAFGAVIEEAVSINDVSVKISSPASQILSVKLKAGNPNIDYFIGGKLEIDTQNAISEEGISLTANSITTSNPILQVITVKIVDDFTGTDYFAGGRIASDQKTIYLGKTLPANNVPLIITYQTINSFSQKFNTQVIRLNKRLPNQNSHVVVTYLPKGVQGDRLSIFKDQFGYMNFNILASGINFTVSAPTFWPKNTWHRVKASYKINGGHGLDEMRLFLDGYEFSNVNFGAGVLFGKFSAGPVEAGDGYLLQDNIKFIDQVNTLFIGSQYSGEGPLFSLIDNFKVSNISRPIYAPYGEPLDVNYNSNLSAAFPVTPDEFTTFLLDFNTMSILNTDFAVLNNRKTGSFDFSINIFDSFDIVSSSAIVKETLEKLVSILKPANTKSFIQYIK